MKEVLSAAANFYLTPTGQPYGEPPFGPMVEAVINVTEPQYTVDAAGQIVKSRSVGQVRFHGTPATMRTLAEHFKEWADAADAMAAKAVTTKQTRK